MNKHFVRKAFAAIFLICTTPALAQPVDTPTVNQGIIDLRNWDFKEGKVALAGTWYFHPNQLIENPAASGRLANFPETFANLSSTPIQTGTFTATVLLPATTDSLAIAIPTVYCSYTLFINGKKIAENGKTGSTKESTTPQWLPLVKTVDHTQDTLMLTLQVANFYHYTGGIKQNLYLGLASTLNNHHRNSRTSTIIECLVLLLLSLGFFIVYYVLQERKKISLYFSLLCLSWAIRTVFSGNYLIIEQFPLLNWTWAARIEYLTLFSIQIWTALFLSRLFYDESSKIVKYFLVGLNSLFVVVTLVTAPMFFTEWMTLYLIVIGALLLYGLVITLRALINARAGVWYLVFSIIMAIGLFSYEVFVFRGFFQEFDAMLFGIGYSLVFVLVSISLFYHLKIFKSEGSETLAFEDLYKN